MVDKQWGIVLVGNIDVDRIIVRVEDKFGSHGCLLPRLVWELMGVGVSSCYRLRLVPFRLARSLTVIVAHTSRPHPHFSGSSIVAAIHLFILVESFACAVDPSLHSESFQLDLRHHRF